MSTTVERQHCAGCYGAAKKAGREVRETDAYPYPLCGLCEGRVRNGLIHYRPANGTEYWMIEERCEGCRHCIATPESPPTLKRPFGMCAWGVLDRLTYQMGAEQDHICHWFEPDDIELKDRIWFHCKRFTDKGDADGELRDPPPPDCEGQLYFSDILTVPERVRQMPVVEGAAR